MTLDAKCWFIKIKIKIEFIDFIILLAFFSFSSYKKTTNHN